MTTRSSLAARQNRFVELAAVAAQGEARSGALVAHWVVEHLAVHEYALVHSAIHEHGAPERSTGQAHPFEGAILEDHASEVRFMEVDVLPGDADHRDPRLPVGTERVFVVHVSHREPPSAQAASTTLRPAPAQRDFGWLRITRIAGQTRSGMGPAQNGSPGGATTTQGRPCGADASAVSAETT